MSEQLTPAVSMPGNFRFGAVPSAKKVLEEAGKAALQAAPGVVRQADAPAPDLGPLAAFVGDWHGTGLNTIFRPDNPETPTPLPVPVAGSDNVLEINLTTETLSFSKSLGSVPNRGSGAQGDIFLNGVPYLQTINDVTLPGQVTGIHFEPGLWVIVPKTNVPEEGPTLARMASIPHGTTINAQGTFFTVQGGPKIDPVDITPIAIGTGKLVPFPSQTVTNQGTPRIPQDLTSFTAAGTITQAILSDPTTVLRNHIAGQNIVSTDVLVIDTTPKTPLFGGGTDNIAFLLGDANGTQANANAIAVEMKAIFWIETVEHDIHIPVLPPAAYPHVLQPAGVKPGHLAPQFALHPMAAVQAPITIKFRTKQIQYVQQVFLNFKGLSWPHVSVATLVPALPIPIPLAALS
ncbi:heme-binding protein [Rhodopila globiformis]|nr:heme-binding protein [Rhodopila globiformis]